MARANDEDMHQHEKLLKLQIAFSILQVSNIPQRAGMNLLRSLAGLNAIAIRDLLHSSQTIPCNVSAALSQQLHSRESGHERGYNSDEPLRKGS
ncbi:MAG: hypothetical protein RBJ76_07130 [Stenomitos frigidus ULC029]